MSEEWPTDVQAAIEWHHEAEVAALEAKRQLEERERILYAQELIHIPETDYAWRREAAKPRVAAQLGEERAGVDRWDLEQAKRHRWLVYLVGKESLR